MRLRRISLRDLQCFLEVGDDLRLRARAPFRTVADRFVFDPTQILGRDLSRIIFGMGLFEMSGSKEAADDIGPDLS